mgnify:CR=1 FL=1
MIQIITDLQLEETNSDSDISSDDESQCDESNQSQENVNIDHNYCLIWININCLH